MRLRPTVILTNAAVVLAVSIGCTRPQAEARYPLTGLVISVDPAGPLVDIAHEEIDGFMPAMAMPFEVRGTLPALSPDDRVSATLVVAEGQSWLENLQVTARGGGAARPSSALRRIEGAAVPDVRLRSHDDRPFTFAALKGHVVLVTFIYTRCPLPDYCPRLMSHLNAVNDALGASPALAKRTRLVAVTLDPAFDTPAVLRAYGQRFVSATHPFARLDLVTGPAAEIQALAGFLGVRYVEESGQMSHSLSTAVIGADGRVARWFADNAWTPDEAVQAMDHEVQKVQ